MPSATFDFKTVAEMQAWVAACPPLKADTPKRAGKGKAAEAKKPGENKMEAADDKPVESEAAEDAPAPAPRQRRSRPGSSGATQPGTADVPEDDAKPSRQRRGRKPSGSSETTEPAPADEGLADADLSKAASQAASVITPAGVKEILEEFSADKVMDIAQDVRQEFLDKLEAAVADAS